MTWRQGTYLMSKIAAAGLVLELAWWVLDPKGDARQHLLDRVVRRLT